MRRALTVLLLAVIPLMMAAVASGAIVANDDIKISYWTAKPAVQSQGPFHAVIYDDDPYTGVGSGTTIESGGDFLSFCVEQTQYFTPGARYNIDAITNVSTLGKTLTGYTAWVYDKFLDFGFTNAVGPAGPVPGGLSSWGYVMNLYQNAVWAGMVGVSGDVGASDAEKTVSVGSSTDYDTAGIGYNDFLASTWGGPAYGESGYDEQDKLDELGVYQVLNIGVNGGNQDQLFLGASDTGVPEPASLLVWSALGLIAGLGVVRRRGRRLGAGRTRWSRENRQAILEVVERRRQG